MARPSKGARLVWRNEYRKADGSLMRGEGWYIEDAGKRVSTRCGRDELPEAQRQLAEYVSSKYTLPRDKDRDPSDIFVADVLDVYLEDVVAKHSRPQETKARALILNEFFGDMKISAITGKVCRDYAAQATTPAAARRQLEDLRAALKHYRREGYVTMVPDVILPEKGHARQRYLTRAEAARLLHAAWRMRQTWKGHKSDRRTGQHLARFILVGLYTGTRSGAICGAAVRPTEGRGYVDLDRGVFHRRGEGVRETKKRQPPVRLNDRLLTHIRRWASTPVDIKTKARGKSKTIGRMVAHDFVVEWQGRPVDRVKKSFRQACEIAGLGWYETEGGRQVFKTDVSPHILRHTAATWLMQAGAKLSDAADFLGMTEQVLRDTYYHHHPDFQATVAELLSTKPAVRKRAGVSRS